MLLGREGKHKHRTSRTRGRRVAGDNRWGRELQSRTAVNPFSSGHQRSGEFCSSPVSSVRIALKNKVQLHPASTVPSNRACYEVGVGQTVRPYSKLLVGLTELRPRGRAAVVYSASSAHLTIHETGSYVQPW